MTTTPDTYTEWDMTVLDEPDHAVPCEAKSHWHTGDSPAEWVTCWEGTPGCRACHGMRLICTPCKDKVMADEVVRILCTECGVWFTGPIRRLMTSIEPLR